jgi:hypothetical protein
MQRRFGVDEKLAQGFSTGHYSRRELVQLKLSDSTSGCIVKMCCGGCDVTKVWSFILCVRPPSLLSFGTVDFKCCKL